MFGFSYILVDQIPPQDIGYNTSQDLVSTSYVKDPSLYENAILIQYLPVFPHINKLSNHPRGLFWILMDNEDKSWMNFLRWTEEYSRGVNNYLDKAFERASQGDEILRPCKKWFYSRNAPHPINDDEDSNLCDDIDGLVDGPSFPGNDIDVYLQLLIAELKDLWETGIKTYDAETNQTFRMRATLLWIVSDFPALAMHSRKMCYLGHRRFLPRDHPLRKDKKSFNDQEGHRPAPTPLSGVEVFAELREFDNVYGKGKKKRPRDNKGPCKQRSISFELPYWAHNKLRHNLDVIHIEKNICDSLVGTLLDIDRKSKDHVNSCYDLQEMGIRKELQPIEDDNGSVSLARACFSMKPEQKRLFCTVMKNAKLQKGCASNISQRVQVKEMKISGYKSHDAHFIMHYLLQVAVRKALPKNVSLTLIRLGNFFRAICSKVIRPRDLEKRGFFRNRSCQEASTAEGFLAEECLSFCSRYLYDGVKKRFSRYQTEDDECLQNFSPIFPNIGHPIGRGKKKRNTFLLDSQSKDEAHRYALFNTGDEQVEKLIEEQKNLMGNHTRSNAWVRARNHSREFSNRFEKKVENVEVPDYLRGLAQGPNSVAKRYTAYFINEYRFHTKTRDAPRKTQNSGVTLSATTDSFASSRDQNPIDGEVIYYGVIQDIIEIDYYGHFSVILFRCNWFHNEVDEYGLTRVYFNRLCSTNDPYVLASQVHQVFYVEDPVEKEVYYARNKIPVDLYDLEEENCPNIRDTFWRDPNDDIGSSSRLPDDTDWDWLEEDD
ncbi:uncharacterized protein LOC132601609 [Lycium barbarum]|uniref:uncharacterized protein LOC132601609 n=1 Tax=Lycium barbarum TaxID=112863 RepID=UPI00293E41F9|nr:uncharacterized protein LOC132601609 [Lycium barbarum]